MTDGQRAERDGLDQECRRLTRLLVDIDPTDYVVRKYVEAHDVLPGLRPNGRFDELLLRWALGPRILGSPAAAFARVFARHGALQHKLVTLLAILETSPVTARVIDAVPDTRAALLVLRLVARGTLAALALVAGALVLVPLRALMGGRRSTA